ncbi:hypothetical protein [Prevotella brunnea]|uniref:hypothetical protein n=1 Tax=Prevotella brunnea TaxID=2508867 RepID=UPI00283AA144|nr:hypothetical protein [Prevotella brunnea]
MLVQVGPVVGTLVGIHRNGAAQESERTDGECQLRQLRETVIGVQLVQGESADGGVEIDVERLQQRVEKGKDNQRPSIKTEITTVTANQTGAEHEPGKINNKGIEKRKTTLERAKRGLTIKARRREHIAGGNDANHRTQRREHHHCDEGKLHAEMTATHQTTMQNPPHQQIGNAKGEVLHQAQWRTLPHPLHTCHKFALKRCARTEETVEKSQDEHRHPNSERPVHQLVLNLADLKLINHIFILLYIYINT